MKAEYRNISSSPGSSFKVSLFEDKEFPAAWHFHPQYELTFILASKGIRYIGDSMDSFENGDLVLVGANLPHCWKTIGEQTENVKCIVIQWDEELLENWLQKKEFKHIQNLLGVSLRGIKFHNKKVRELESSLKELIHLEPFERLLSFMRILQNLALTNDFELLAGTGFTNNLSIKESERINMVYHFVKENSHRQIALQEIADQVAMSKEAFCRFFKKTFNKSFFSFLNEYKINLASKMLIDTDFSISEIAYKIGYNNLTFFYRQFHKFMKMSPSKYRRAYQLIPM